MKALIAAGLLLCLWLPWRAPAMRAPTPTPNQFVTPAPTTPTPTLTPARVELAIVWIDHAHARLTWAASYGPVTLLHAPASGAVVVLGTSYPKNGTLDTLALPYDIFIARLLTGEQASAQPRWVLLFPFVCEGNDNANATI
jgi:hypothetical protein